MLNMQFAIDDILPALREALAASPQVILTAPPGAGKSVRVPLALLECPWLEGKKIIMLEPRRLAARRAAEFMAQQLGEKAGRTVGYRIRGTSVISRETRIEVVTEGILTRMLHRQADLPGVGLVIFDEFHERSIHADLGLAFALDVQRHLRDDLRLLVMSATLDGVALAGLLPDAPLVTGEASAWPVQTFYSRPAPEQPLARRIAAGVDRALSAGTGDLLVFLPGMREIRQAEEILLGRLPEEVVVTPLHGDLPLRVQETALTPAPAGCRKVILATSIAETSLTIPGVRMVLDSGLARAARFDPRRGMSALVTLPVSRAQADQRRGRAGRTAPGLCFRLWSESEEAQLSDFPQPEIRSADLAHLALDLALWGDPSGENLAFIDPPPPPHLSRARELLARLGALDADGRLTPHGSAMAALLIHPRLAHMILKAQAAGCGGAACDLAALLEEGGSPAAGRSQVDLAAHIELLHGVSAPAGRRGRAREGGSGDDKSGESGKGAAATGGSGDGRSGDGRSGSDRIAFQAMRLRELAGIIDSAPGWVLAGAHGTPGVTDTTAGRTGVHRAAPAVTKSAAVSPGLLVAWAFPDRVARRREDRPGTFQLANGTAAALPAGDPLAREEFLAIAAVDAADGRGAAERTISGAFAVGKIYLAAALSRAELLAGFAGELRQREEVVWDARQERVRARRVVELEYLVVDETAITPDPELAAAAMAAGIRSKGLHVLPWEKESRRFQARAEWARRLKPEWPDFSDDALQAGLEDWLQPHLSGLMRLEQLQTLPLAELLRARLTGAQRHELDQLAPAWLAVPSGSRIAIEYAAEGDPVLAVKLQELFGLVETPRIGGGRVPLTIHLLSPAARPLAVTQDLRSFWEKLYPEIRRQLRARYPKHPWPEDPLTAEPTRKTLTAKR